MHSFGTRVGGVHELCLAYKAVACIHGSQAECISPEKASQQAKQHPSVSVGHLTLSGPREYDIVDACSIGHKGSQ